MANSLKFQHTSDSVMLYRKAGLWFEPDKNGRYFAKNDNGFTLEMNYGKRFHKCWRLPCGTISRISLEPEPKYRFKNDRYIPDKNGDYTIGGKYPLFHVHQTGLFVYLNADQTMSLAPVNFKAQAEMFAKYTRLHEPLPLIRHRKAAFLMTEEEKILRRVNVKTHSIRQIGHRDYEWKIFVNGEMYMTGYASSKDQAREEIAMVKSGIAKTGPID